MREQGLDAVLIRETPNIAYLTGFVGVFDEERAHALLVSSGNAVLHTDSRYLNACKQAAEQAASTVAIDGEAITHAKWLGQQLTHDDAIHTLGIEDSMSLAEFHKLEEELPQNVELKETSGLVNKQRGIKNTPEIECMRAAQAITDAAFAHITAFIRPDMTEREVARELDNYMLTHGADALAFPTILACGANGANPHAQPTDARLEVGQCVVMDFGAKRAGYCSDMTRTIFIGQPSERMSSAYAALREANETVEAMLKPGVTGVQAHQQALDILEAAGFKEAMGHGLGHSLGLEIHEDPVLSPRNKEALAAGNVVTVEPGIYLPGEFGMRLEDFGLITETGFEVITQAPHEPVIIEP